MSRISLPQEIDLATLLASIEGEEFNSDVKPNFDTPILSFIQAFNISQGKELVSDRILYNLFRTWHKDTFIDKKNFNTQFTKYFTYKQSDRKYFYVNKDFVSISNLIQEHTREHTLDKRKSRAWQKHFARFLDETKLKPGTIFLEADILYYVYTRWADSIRRKNLFSYYTFCQIVSLHFEKKILSVRNMAWFGISPEIKNLINKEEVARWRNYRNNKNGKKDSKKSRAKYEQKHLSLYPENFKKPQVGRPPKRSRKKIHTKKPG